MEKRYERNIPAITEEEQKKIFGTRIAIIGLGGLGGYLAEMAARLGFGGITVCDGDTFDETNLNRQLLSSEGNLGSLKSEAAKAWIESINPAAQVKMHCRPFDEENAEEILAECDIVLDALDSVRSRLILENECEKRSIPIVHGAISGWMAQAAVAQPGHSLLHKIYAGSKDDGEQENAAQQFGESAAQPETESAAQKSTIVATPAFCASVQMSEAVKLALGRKPDLEDTLLLADLETMTFQTVSF